MQSDLCFRDELPHRLMLACAAEPIPYNWSLPAFGCVSVRFWINALKFRALEIRKFTCFFTCCSDRHSVAAANGRDECQG